MGYIADSNSWQGQHLKADILFSRAGVAQHILIGSPHGTLLIDTGDGCLRDLLAATLPLETLSGLLYTHGHFDHVGGLHSLLGFFRMIGRREPLPVCAPEGCTEVFAIAHNFRRCYPDSIPFSIQLRELHPHKPFELAGLRIEPFPMVHAGSTDAGILDPIPAFGYRLSLNDETVAVTGDTGICDEARALVTDADLAIIEATFADTDESDMEIFEKVHLSEPLAHELGALAKNYMLVHRSEIPE